MTRNGQVVARMVPPERSAVLDPDLLASRRDRIKTSEDLPNLVLLARQEERF